MLQYHIFRFSTDMAHSWRANASRSRGCELPCGFATAVANCLVNSQPRLVDSQPRFEARLRIALSISKGLPAACEAFSWRARPFATAVSQPSSLSHFLAHPPSQPPSSPAGLPLNHAATQLPRQPAAQPPSHATIQPPNRPAAQPPSHSARQLGAQPRNHPATQLLNHPGAHPASQAAGHAATARSQPAATASPGNS